LIETISVSLIHKELVVITRILRTLLFVLFTLWAIVAILPNEGTMSVTYIVMVDTNWSTQIIVKNVTAITEWPIVLDQSHSESFEFRWPEGYSEWDMAPLTVVFHTGSEIPIAILPSGEGALVVQDHSKG
jgi:hypothetical protein